IFAGWPRAILPMGASAARIKSPATLVDALGDAPSDGGSIPPASTLSPLRFQRLGRGGPSPVPIFVPAVGRARWWRRSKGGGDPPAVGARQRRHPPAVVPEDHLLRRAADLRHPARIFARRERVRDERVADVVLPARVKAAAPKRREPHPFVEPLLGERLPRLVGEDVLAVAGAEPGAPASLEGSKDLRVAAPIHL